MKPLPLPERLWYPAAMEDRITKLEVLATLQDETIGKLNDELFRQQQDIARLQRHIESLENRMAELAGPDSISGNERPPHY